MLISLAPLKASSSGFALSNNKFNELAKSYLWCGANKLFVIEEARHFLSVCDVTGNFGVLRHKVRQAAKRFAKICLTATQSV